MTSPEDKQKIIQERIKKAFDLAKEGQYQKARFILRDIEHPKAKQLLEMLADKKEKKRKAKSSMSPLAIFMVVFVVLAIGGTIAAALFFQDFMSQFTLDELFVPDNDDYFGVEFTEEEEVALDLISYCFDYTGYGGSESCYDWADDVVRTHYEEARACFAPYKDELFLSNAQNDAVGECLREAGLSNPF